MARQPALAAQVSEVVRDEFAATIGALGQDAVLWLVVAPVWSRGVAEAAGFPAESIPGFIRRARDVGWCEYRGELDPEPDDEDADELLFWMPDGARRDVVQAIAAIRPDPAGALGSSILGVSARTIAGAVEARVMQAAFLSREAFPGALREWLAIMTEKSPATALVERAREASEAGDLPRAQQLVAAGTAIAAVLSGPAELALDRAKRLLSLAARRRQDTRALGRYLDRPELSGAIDALLDPKADEWALHLRGVGGVGKTMLIRYLAAGRYAASRGLDPIAVARVDFDYITPDYPARKPVELLVELADELALHTALSGTADYALESFRARAMSVHERLSGGREDRGMPVEDPLVGGAIDDFAAAVTALPRVLLILDTCEELAKADAGDPSAPAVSSTMSIIERLHERAPSVRVLFAGRRPLPARPYLRVQQVAGFTAQEARQYLSTFTSRPLDAGLADEIIRQSPAVDGPVPRSGVLPDQISPFDLALYCSWADEDPRLSARDVAGGSDAYVEGRIIDRLGDPLVKRALPLLAVCGRCRVATLAALLDADAATLGSRLAEQEWVDAGAEHVQARPALATRLVHYFSSPERAYPLSAVASQLSSQLLETTRAAALEAVDVDEMLTGLRLSAPGGAAGLWDGIGDKAVAEGRWSWLYNVARRVQGESQYEGWPTAAALRATVGASFIAASRRLFPLLSVEAPWRDVLKWAEHHPDTVTAAVLRQRAIRAVLPYAPDDESLWEGLTLAVARFGTTLAPGAAETAHRLLEAGHLDAAVRFSQAGFLDAAADGVAGSRVAACAWIVIARLRADGDPEHALAALARADAAAAAVTDSERPWPDLIPPDDLLARTRIERGLIAPPKPGDGILHRWEDYAADHIASIDGERLAGLCLRIRLGHGVVGPASALERWDAVDGYNPERQPTCTAHDLVPPLFVMRAEAWLALGHPGRALAIVTGRREEGLRTRDDEATVHQAEAELMRITRKTRSDSHPSILSRWASMTDPQPSEYDLVASACRTTAVVYREAPREPRFSTASSRPAGWHAWWQSQRSPLTWVIPPRGWPSDAANIHFAADIDLDFTEMRSVGDRIDADNLEEPIAGWLAQPRPPRPPVRSADAHRDVRVGLRREALTGEPYAPRPGVPLRLLAEMAFEEAELLALRLPDQAAALFTRAAQEFEVAGDYVGQLLASIALTSIRLPASAPRDGLTLPSTLLDGLRATSPVVHAALTGPLPDAGPWQYWAERLRAIVAENVTQEGAFPQPAVPGKPTAEPAPVDPPRAMQAYQPSYYQQEPAGPGSAPVEPYWQGGYGYGSAPSQPVPPPGQPGGYATTPKRRRRRAWPFLVAAMLVVLAGAGALALETAAPGGHPTSAGSAPTSAGSAPTSAGSAPVTGSPTPTPGGSAIASQGVSGTAGTSPSSGPSSTAGPPSPTASGTAAPSQSASVNVGGLGSSTIPHPPPPRSSASPAALAWLIAIAAVVVTALLGLTAWRLRRLVRLATYRGLGTLPVSRLYFEAVAGTGRRPVPPDPGSGGGADTLSLRVRSHPDAVQAPRAEAAARRVIRWARSGRPFGYRATFDLSSPQGWYSLAWSPRPQRVGGRWWTRGPDAVHAEIRNVASPDLASVPWERFLAQELGPHANGRIEWTRVVSYVPALFPRSPSAAAGIAIHAPAAWGLTLASAYAFRDPRVAGPVGQPARLRLRHAIGRAVITAAGPRLDVGTPNEPPLMGPEDLADGQPLLVILQAEPYLPGDEQRLFSDLPEMLALATYLMTDGTPAVLIIPPLPFAGSVVLAELMRHAKAGLVAEPRVLRRDLRQAARQDKVPAAVLDDFILMVNPQATPT